ncbi:hypothetical protein DV735_g4877, partial [Chaetothyriales sp. CBS 134920]
MPYYIGVLIEAIPERYVSYTRPRLKLVTKKRMRIEANQVGATNFGLQSNDQTTGLEHAALLKISYIFLVFRMWLNASI